ncbi:2-aminoethanethiol dioxygenase-like [Mytilus galloprovincialis]|uniref:2-aminoethanethiol dioxygenase-like n=1 Tax=Mytilus galloprovincialis TaxID=29158 RepID=UPI003F7C6499
MVSNIQKVAQTAYRLFSRICGNSDVLLSSQNVGLLTSMMNTIKDKDVNFDMSKISLESETPVSYIDIYEDPVMTMAIFIIRDGCKIPLHDHPGMYGFCKVIHGSARMKSFSDPQNFVGNPPENIASKIRPYLRQSIKPVILEEESIFSSDDNCCVVTPNHGTYHELVAVNGPVAFLDILAPSYDHASGARICQYYEEIKGQNEEIKHLGKPLIWFTPISQPSDFWCDPEEYEGPSVVDALNEIVK